MNTSRNKILQGFYSLTLKERKLIKFSKPLSKEPTIQDYYDMEDACSFLEQLRAYQLADILGKYKLF